MLASVFPWSDPVKRIILLCLVLGLASPALAEEKNAEAQKPLYHSLVPALVGNFGSSTGKLRYYKADIALRVSDSESEERVKYHEPLIRNQLVTLFSQQSDSTLAGVEAKEALRKEALKQVRAVLSHEEGKPLVDDLLFNNLIIQ